MSPNSESRNRNQKLREEFSRRALDPDKVLPRSLEDRAEENEHLTRLLEWVEAYEKFGSRETMEKLGYDYPPVFPDFDPDTDWLRFELWFSGNPTSYSLNDRLPRELVDLDPAEMSDTDMDVILEKLVEILRLFNVVVDYHGSLPPRIEYRLIQESLDEEFFVISNGNWHFDGCSGFCPDCLRRPWCDVGGQLCFPEDEEAGKIIYHDDILDSVSPSPMSLQILLRNQEESEQKMLNDEFDSDFDSDSNENDDQSWMFDE